MLLSFSQQQGIKPFSKNSETGYPVIANEVEQLELSKMLGRSFYQAVAARPEDYTDLLDGVTYTDCDNNEVSTIGLRYVLAYLNYSKYVGTNHLKDTFSGHRIKSIPESTPITQGDINRLQSENRTIALYEWENIKEYLNLNYTLYPLWGYKSNKMIEKPTIYSIRK